MVPHRRRLLGAVGLIVASAGCGSRGQRDRTPTPTVADNPDQAVETGSVSGDDVPPTLRLRGGTDAPPVRRPPSERRRRPFDDRGWDVDSWLLDRENADTVRVAPDGRETVREFLAATDFETETVYVQSMQVLSCFTVTLCSVSWGSDEVKTDYGRHLKPYTAACEADTRVYESRLIRIPAEIESGSYSTSLGGNACRGVDRRGDGGSESDDTESGDGRTDSGTATTETATQTETRSR